MIKLLKKNHWIFEYWEIQNEQGIKSGEPAIKKNNKNL